MSAIMVDRGTPGLSLGKAEDKMGIRAASVSKVIFEDCRVPRSNLPGREGVTLCRLYRASDSSHGSEGILTK